MGTMYTQFGILNALLSYCGDTSDLSLVTCFLMEATPTIILHQWYEPRKNSTITLNCDREVKFTTSAKAVSNTDIKPSTGEGGFSVVGLSRCEVLQWLPRPSFRGKGLVGWVQPISDGAACHWTRQCDV